jgi:hypothetical protein
MGLLVQSLRRFFTSVKVEEMAGKGLYYSSDLPPFSAKYLIFHLPPKKIRILKGASQKPPPSSALCKRQTYREMK